MSEVTILQNCRGINTRDHPTELENKYLAKAVNVDVSDKGSVSRRGGYNIVTDGLTNAHSVAVLLNRYVIYADGENLFCYDSVSEVTTTIKTDLTADKPISFTFVGDELAFTNGIERGRISVISSTVGCVDYFEFVNEDNLREVVNFPFVDCHHFYNGSMYGFVRGESFVYCSEPYKLGQYDQEKGYLLLPSSINWISNLEEALLVGTDSGITAFAGHGLSDFQEKTNIWTNHSELCSDRMSVQIKGNTYHGLLSLTDRGIIFISDQLDIVDMTSKLTLNWNTISSGCFYNMNNSYIFSGGIS